MRIRASLLSLVLALLSGCSTAPLLPPLSEPLTQPDREAAFGKVWRTIHDAYVDPHFNGVDWTAVGLRYRALALAAADDRAFWRTLDRMVGELKDTHTLVLSPQEAAIAPNESYGLGVQLASVAEGWVVWRVAPNSQADLLGIKPGDLLVQVDNFEVRGGWQDSLTDTKPHMSERSRMSLVNQELNTGLAGSLVTMTLEQPGGRRYSVELRRERRASPASLRAHELASGVGYLRFSDFDENLYLELMKALDRFTDVSGLVIDLRGNPGGSHAIVEALLNRIVTRQAQPARAVTRNGKPIRAYGLIDVTPTFDLKPSEKAIKAPVAVLVDQASASASELVAAVLQDMGRARVFGSTSCGCLLGVRSGTRLPGGGLLMFSEVDFVIGQNKRIEGSGVQPDDMVPLTRQALIERRDPVLEAALAWLQVTGDSSFAKEGR